jgi:hypothetical protein
VQIDHEKWFVLQCNVRLLWRLKQLKDKQLGNDRNAQL